MTERPQGTVTFLFTDVEGSTRLWDEWPTEMEAALGAHDHLVRKAIEDAGGYVFTTAGDAFAAAFTDPMDAVSAAVALQRALNTQDWGKIGEIRVRAAVHTGIAEERGGDYFGPPLNRTSRILSAGHGEQVLLSAATEHLVHARLSDGAATKDLGDHHLKDLGEPEHIYQLTHPHLRDDFPPLLSLSTRPNNLPVQLSSFVGRQAELDDVVKRLKDTRLMTLTGVGGSGKTRLALQAAAESLDDYARGVWFVELAPVSDPDLITHAIGDALRLAMAKTDGLGAGSARTPLETLVEHLRNRELLLVLDNCEHLITGVAHVVQALLAGCPDVTVLATSREGLGIIGETLWQVPSLTMPLSGDDPSESDSVQLFVARASAVNPAFSTDTANLEAVAEICRRLDGMPLAIELAAARSKMMQPNQIADRLEDRFRLLTGGSRTALPRHQTLEATVDWSYGLLPEQEQVLFNRLAAFRGGFSLELAEQVCVGGGIDEFDVLELVGNLVDKSMVTQDELSGRLLMLETLRQYAQRKLTESNEVDEVRLKHLQAISDLFARTADDIKSPRQEETLIELQHDHENLRSAIAFGLENGHELEAITLVHTCRYFWISGGHRVDWREWISRSVQYADLLDDYERCEYYAWATEAASWLGFVDEARGYVEESERIAIELGEPMLQALAAYQRAMFSAMIDEYQLAQEALVPSVEIIKTQPASWEVGLLWFVHGQISRILLDLEVAEEAFEYARRVWAVHGGASDLARVLTWSGPVRRYRGDYEAEVAMATEAMEIYSHTGNEDGIRWALGMRSISLSKLGRQDEALADIERSIRIDDDIAASAFAYESYTMRSQFLRRAGDRESDVIEMITNALDSWKRYGSGLDGLAHCVEEAAEFGFGKGLAEDPVRINGWALQIRASNGRRRPPTDDDEWEAFENSLRTELGETRYDELINEGAGLSGEEVEMLARNILSSIEETL